MRVAAVCRETHSRNKHSNGLNSWAPIYLSWERARMSRQHSVNVDALNERHTKQTMSQIPAQCTAANASRTPSMISFGGQFIRSVNLDHSSSFGVKSRCPGTYWQHRFHFNIYLFSIITATVNDQRFSLVLH